MDLAKQFDKAIAEVQDKVLEGAVIPIVEDVATQAVLWTPVDTGNARHNWKASLNAPSYGSRQYTGDDGANGARKFSAPDMSPAAMYAIEDMKADINEMTVDTKVVYITNSVEYIVDLDDGKSIQSYQFAQRAVTIGASRAIAVIEAKGQLNAFS